MIPLLALLFSSTLAAAPAILGPEIPVGDPAFGNAALGQIVASVASNGRDYLVLWNDQRNSAASGRRAALYAGRVDANGHPTDPPGHKLVDDAEGQIVWNGTSYVLIYDVEGISFEQLLDDDGKPLGPPIHLDLGGPSLAIGTNRSNVLTVDASGEVFLVGFDGSVTRQHVGHQLSGVSQIGAAPDGSYFFAATWADCVGPCAQHIELEHVDATSGVVTHSLRSDVSYGTQVAGSATDDGRLLLAWNDPRADQFSVRYEIVDFTGHLLAGPALLANSASFYGLSTGWDGHEFLVAFAGQSWRLSANGQVVEHAVVADPAPLFFARSAAGVLEARNVVTLTDSDVFVRAATSFAQLPSAEERSVAMSSRQQASPHLAASEAGFTAWFEFTPAPSLMVQPVGGAITHVADVAPWNAYYPPALAIGRGSNSYLVAWEAVVDNKLGFLAKRLALDGTPLDAEPFRLAFDELSISELTRTISIAFDGRNFLAIWPEYGSGAIHGARISQDGKLLDATPLVLSQPDGHLAATPSVVWNGKNFVIAWLDELFCSCLISPPPPPRIRVYAVRAGSDGPIDREPIVVWDKLIPVSSLGLATDGADAALVWTTAGCVYATTLRADGTLGGDPQTLTCRTLPKIYNGAFDNAGVAWSGSEYVAIWTDPDLHQLHGERLDFSGGDAIPIDGFDVTPAGVAVSQPDIASTAAGVAIAYVRPAPEPQFGGAPRIFIRNLNRLGVIPRRRASR